MVQATLTPDREEQWAKEQGLPSFTDPPLRQYLLGRDALIKQERKQRSDYAFRETLSPTAAHACRIVSHIRSEEHQTVWTDAQETDLAAKSHSTIYPGMMFSKARLRAESTRLWKIVSQMPKGALLHCHLSAMVDPDWLLDQLFALGGMHMSATAPMDTSDARQSVAVRFRWRRPTDHKHDSIWIPAYTSDTFIPVEMAADTFPHGGRDAFRSWFQARATITDDEHLATHKGPDEIWLKFHSCFLFLSDFFHYEPLMRAIMRHILPQLANDGVRWLDLRDILTGQFYETESEVPIHDDAPYIRVIDQEIVAFSASPQGQRFWGARIILCGIRTFGTQKIVEGMQACISLKLKFPHLIAGYDLVGHEDRGRPLTDLLLELFWFKKSCAEHGVDIPFFFHAGETLGDGTETDENLYDAILLGTRRIGHGFSLHKHPLLMDMIKDKHILVESCPISNEVLRLTSTIMTHPLPALLARGVPVALCSDDPAVMGQGAHGMTHNFWQALQAWENLGLEGLASLAENSVRYAAFEDCGQKQWVQEIKDGSIGNSLRARRLREWSLEWEKFCLWIVNEFGEDEQDLEPEEHDGPE